VPCGRVATAPAW